MPLVPFVDLVPPPAPAVEWQIVCDAVAQLMKKVAGNARIHAKWELKMEIGDTLDLCRVEAEGNRVNGVMIGIAEAIPTPVSNQKIGGGTRYFQFDWELKLDIWQLKGYEMGTNTDNSRLRLQRQCRDATAIMMMYRGAKQLGILGSPGIIQVVGMLEWPSIDVYGFGEGADVEISQGVLNVKMREQFQNLA